MWGLETKWKQQCKRGWPETSWFEDGRVIHVGGWGVEWILTEENKLPGSSHVFWRKAKGRVMYKRRPKHTPPPGGWKEQLLRVLHCKDGGAIEAAINLVLLHI